MARHDIMHGSQAWERVSNGVPREISDVAMRQMFHDYAQIMAVTVDALNRALDDVESAKILVDQEHGRIHTRIDRRGEAHDALKDQLFNPKTGLLVEQERASREYTDRKTGRMTGVLLVVLGGVVTGCVMLAIQIGTRGVG